MGSPVTVTRIDYTASALRGLAARTADAAQARRMLALAMVLEGAKRVDAARVAGMDRQTLRDWVHRYNETSVTGLISRVPPGAAPKLTSAQMAELRALVVAGPDPQVHKVIRWRCLDLREEVARRFAVTVDEGTIGRWLNKFGLTRLQPRPFHPKKDPAAAQEAFKKRWVPMPEASATFNSIGIRLPVGTLTLNAHTRTFPYVVPAHRPLARQSRRVVF